MYSISCTTRAPRSGETDGEDYFFLEEDDFRRRRASGEFLEWAEVHGNFYGTLRQPVLDRMAEGTDVLIDIDTQGAAQIRASDSTEVQDSLADVFIMPPSLDELRHRLEKRGTETPQQMEIRIGNAAREMESWRDYRYTIVSGAVEEDLQSFRAIMRAERMLSRRLIHR